MCSLWLHLDQMRMLSCHQRHSFCQSTPSTPRLTSQRHSALISSDSEYCQVCFSAVHYLKISEQRCSALKQRWIFQFWTALIQRKPSVLSTLNDIVVYWWRFQFYNWHLFCVFMKDTSTAMSINIGSLRKYVVMPLTRHLLITHPRLTEHESHTLSSLWAIHFHTKKTVTDLAMTFMTTILWLAWLP